jgi:CubicO group peptidase (beta-lactamase class C family)
VETSTDKDAAAELQLAPGATQGYGSPAGGLFGTAADMQHFADALLQDKLLSAGTRKVLTSPQIVVIPVTDGRPELSYGMGFGVGSEGDKRWFGHNGGTAGANVEFAEFPDEQWTLAVFSNRDPPVASTMLQYLKDLLFKPDALRTCATTTSN